MSFLGEYRFYLRTVFPLFFLVTLVFPFQATAGEASYLDALLKKAQEENLHADRYWEILLHYKPSGSGMKSLIDDPRFFLSPDGKKNPAAELDATLKAFFESEETGDEHPRCRFIARYAWLSEKLDFDDSALSDIQCPGWEELTAALRPRSVALIFPAFFMNNPASMFGHTLIRIDGSYQSKLLSYATNYAASTDARGFLYPFKGIFGFYKGYFSLFPYYDMIKKYNDTEQRDMWEYPLDLSGEEVWKMFMHLWELKGIYSYYYFFDENCSYNLLFLLEAARPSLELTDRMGLWAIPVDTIRVVKDGGIIRNFEYRPSRAAKIRHIASLLNKESQETALKLADESSDVTRLSALGDQERTKILDLAIETIQYKYSQGDLSKDAYLKLFLSTLRERSQSGDLSNAGPDQVPVPLPPIEGHRSSRLSLSAGIEEEKSFQGIGYRPSYHALSDPDGGYLEGSQIIFANTDFRFYEDGKLRLEAFDLIDVASFSPRDYFFKPLSFKIKTGLTRKKFDEGGERLVWQVNPGIGLAFANQFMGLYYGLAEIDLNMGGGLRDGYSAGAGIEVGAIRNLTDVWKVQIVAETLLYEWGERFPENKISVVQIYGLNRNNSLNLSLLWDEVSNDDRLEAALGWNYYF